MDSQNIGGAAAVVTTSSASAPVTQSLHAAAESAFAKAKNREQAVSKLVKLLNADPKLRNDAVLCAARYLVRQQEFAVRQMLFSPVSQDTEKATERGAMAARYAMLDDFALCNGVRLGDATIDDLEDAILTHEKHAAGATLKARFLQEIRDRLAPGDRVADKLSESDIQRIRENLTC